MRHSFRASRLAFFFGAKEPKVKSLVPRRIASSSNFAAGGRTPGTFAKYSLIGFVYGYAIGQPNTPSVPIIAYLNIQAARSS